jgi:hypothetical protein
MYVLSAFGTERRQLPSGTRCMGTNGLELCVLAHAVVYTGCNRMNVPNFGRVFLMLNYTEKTQKSKVERFGRSWPEKFETLTAVKHLLSFHIKTGRNMWFE